MENCVFCEIAWKKEGAEMVYEYDRFMAFLDIRPRTRGHTLVLPKKHYRWVYEVSEIGSLFETAKLVAEGIRKALHPVWLQFITIGEAVQHAHVHVFPRYANDGHGVLPNLTRVENIDSKEMKEIASEIAKEIVVSGRKNKNKISRGEVL